tara:strand:+ start:3810 stop:3923 length:114 start_codon:yes stop_codon:yes gene_type:complete
MPSYGSGWRDIFGGSFEVLSKKSCKVLKHFSFSGVLA